MRYMNRQRIRSTRNNTRDHAFRDDDPLTGVGNLFDIGLVFIVGLIMALFSVYHLQDLFSETSSFTLLKQNAHNQEMEIITKQGKTIKAVKVTKDTVQGRGRRLGTAYQLEDGNMVYVPE
ncbi:DUF2149 domain-containing protein [Desulfatitalea alkaliphila]|uniref:DUF2149 domain-containing protein n=1 Tax=Desulfatitalea alkaliphila TaxID=2929485 RepID=A0AA41UIN5_9BACT|nr:DUF2149 domain-containing protein [Desulfatitalea alkaliphila]MCJ8499737.1 DUF2149 domain-containing protein [Desulfatitalea alkaliphila]